MSNQSMKSMNLKRCLTIGILLFCGLDASAQTKPNIVFILVDDMPWYGTSVLMDAENPGSAMAYIQMPNVERLAKQGMVFRNARAAAGMCAPSSRRTADRRRRPRGARHPGIVGYSHNGWLSYRRAGSRLPFDACGTFT